MYNFQDYSVLYNNTVGTGIYEDWHFTHIWTRHFAKRWGLRL